MQSYAALHETVTEQEESGVLIHVVESSRPKWNHVEDLDSFFSRMYRYHQRHGFSCMMVQEVLELVQFVFVVSFSTFLVHCVNYPMLFRDVPNSTITNKITISDIVYPPQVCRSHFTPLTWIALLTAAVIWTLRFIRGIYHMFHYWDIKQFYNLALKISDADLDNLTWHEIQTRVRAVQLEQQMCIHKRELSELDIYHRILRQQNYFIAMANKRLLPARLQVPFIGEVVYWTHGLRYNMQMLLFWGPWAPFQNPWHLREEYRKANMRHELAKKLGRYILWLALANLLLSPLILLWQVLYAFFSYAELVKREPGSLGLRSWSKYARLFLRHFNELDHELQTRLNRAHRAASHYLACFSSPMATVIARGVAFMCGAVLAVLLVLTVYDEDVLGVEHLLTIITLLGTSLAICRTLIPNDTLAWSPETLLANVVAHTHYLPAGWQGQSHTARIRAEFQQLFQYRFVGLLEELVSPVLTPYILWRHVYPRALEIVDFYRNFTVSVVGVGDVCSFAQMDVRKHGNPDWQGQGQNHQTAPDQYTQAEDGKTELSLIHFTLTNPNWKPPPEAQQFVESVQVDSAQNDYSHQMDLQGSSTYGISYKMEEPANSISDSMSLSTLYLHDRRYRQAGGNYVQRPVLETTPLLSSR